MVIFEIVCCHGNSLQHTHINEKEISGVLLIFTVNAKGETNSSILVLHLPSGVHTVKKVGSHFKVLLRRNFDIMFVTKIRLYQLIKKDCNNIWLKWRFSLHKLEKNSPEKLFFSRPPSWIYVPVSLRYRAAPTCYCLMVFLSWRHFLNSRWRFLM